jgi:hypothetical protein
VVGRAGTLDVVCSTKERQPMRLSLRLSNPFSFLFVSSRRERYLAEYISREAARGRSLDDVLADPYVRNRSTPEERARVLELPQIVEAVGEHAVAEMKRSLEGGATLAGAPR